MLSNDHKSKPMLVGGRIKLEYALKDVKADMIIATSGNTKRCVILVDFSADDIWEMIQRAEKEVFKLKAIN